MSLVWGRYLTKKLLLQHLLMVVTNAVLCRTVPSRFFPLAPLQPTGALPPQRSVDARPGQDLITCFMTRMAPLLGLCDAPQRICCTGHHQPPRVECLSQEGGPTDDGTRQGSGGRTALHGRDSGAVAGRLGATARDGARR